jgi:endonuclease-3 related protein
MTKSAVVPQIVTMNERQAGARSAMPLTTLGSYFAALFAEHGPQHWWPGRSRFETIAGAILTQNTSWRNVERALTNLREARLLSPEAILRVPWPRLASCLRPAGYFRQKSRTLKSFVAFLFARHEGSLDRLFARPTELVRNELLRLRGIGPETADSILLYAGKHPVFVVDAYTRRILDRHSLWSNPAKDSSAKNYEAIRAFFESELPPDHQLFNEFHALLVHTGKHYCFKTDPSCSGCPLEPFLPGDVRRAAAVKPWQEGQTFLASNDRLRVKRT